VLKALGTKAKAKILAFLGQGQTAMGLGQSRSEEGSRCNTTGGNFEI